MKLFPVDIEVPPEIVVYHSTFPELALAFNVTLPVPQVYPGVPDKEETSLTSIFDSLERELFVHVDFNL